jgi:hypothetical protein
MAELALTITSPWGGTMLWTAELAALVAVTWGVAWPAHQLGRSAERRAWWRRRLLHRTVPWGATGLIGLGVLTFVLLPIPQPLPRRYADYLPSDGGGDVSAALGWPAAAGLISTGVLVLAVWAWLRSGRPSGSSRLRHVVPATGGALLLASCVGGWIGDRVIPPSFGWFAYAPLTDAAVAPRFANDQSLGVRQVTTTLAVAGLAALTAMIAFRAGRRETG